ncbi:terpenoid synthase [Phlebopus sp. FC_14]|nr:terpenoid synthase [Phlebopus sp. FC_14]
MAPSTSQIVLPDLLSSCPLKFGEANPHYKEAGAESKAWINAYNVVSIDKRASFDRCYTELLCSRVYPYAGYEELRTCCDLINLLFVFDDFSDDMGSEDAWSACDTFYHSMTDLDVDDNSVLARITSNFRERFTFRAKSGCFERFLVRFRDYTEAVAKEAELREFGDVPDLCNYVALRRENSAVQLCLSMVEYNLGIELPDAVIEDPAFQSAYWAVVDMVCWSNDIYSYKSEQSRGHGGNNIVTVLVLEEGISVQDAMDRAGVVFGELMDRYLRDKCRIRSWGPEIDEDVAQYMDAIGYWVVGNLQWSFETPRYFGDQREEVLRTRRIDMNI